MSDLLMLSLLIPCIIKHLVFYLEITLLPALYPTPNNLCHFSLKMVNVTGKLARKLRTLIVLEFLSSLYLRHRHSYA